MSEKVKDYRESRLAVLELPTGRGSARFIRLAQLRKLRLCEQVAAVCYRVRGGRIEFLLVQTRGSGRWTFPKGGAEPGLTHAQAAALEAFEEAGVHGRIDETSFARYVRRQRGSTRSFRSSNARYAEEEFPVNAFLCQVLRLSPPQEARRNRTWFSTADARQRLREGRRGGEGAALARVLDKAEARILQLLSGSIFVEQKARPQQFREERYPVREDALQKVQFECPQSYAGVEEASSMRFRPQAGGGRRPGPVDSDRRKILPCEVLEFGNPGGLLGAKKVKALGTGASEG